MENPRKASSVFHFGPGEGSSCSISLSCSRPEGSKPVVQFCSGRRLKVFLSWHRRHREITSSTRIVVLVSKHRMRQIQVLFFLLSSTLFFSLWTSNSQGRRSRPILLRQTRLRYQRSRLIRVSIVMRRQGPTRKSITLDVNMIKRL